MTRAIGRALIAAASLAAACAIGRDARADTPPDPWEAIKRPELAREWKRHVEVRKRLLDAFERPRRDAERQEILAGAARALEQAGAAKSQDVRLRFDLGQIYAEMLANKAAIDVLRPALESAPDHPAAAGAWWYLAISYARLGRVQEERDAYLRHLAEEFDDPQRVTSMLNLAEAEMRLGHMNDAIARYRDAMALAGSLAPSRGVLSATIHIAWGLAVALDRNGEPTAAREQAKIALGLDPRLDQIAFSPDYFFVPAYERHYYVGVGMIEQARQSGRPEDWLRAQRPWEEYLRLAAHADDKWLAFAKAHLAECRREHAAAVARSARRK